MSTTDLVLLEVGRDVGVRNCILPVANRYRLFEEMARLLKMVLFGLGSKKSQESNEQIVYASIE